MVSCCGDWRQLHSINMAPPGDKTDIMSVPRLACWPTSEQTPSQWLDTLRRCPTDRQTAALTHITILLSQIYHIDCLQHKRTMSTKRVFEKITKKQRSYVPLCRHTIFVLYDTGMYCDCYWQHHDILQRCKQNKHFRQITSNKYYTLHFIKKWHSVRIKSNSWT